MQRIQIIFYALLSFILASCAGDDGTVVSDGETYSLSFSCDVQGYSDSGTRASAVTIPNGAKMYVVLKSGSSVVNYGTATYNSGEWNLVMNSKASNGSGDAVLYYFENPKSTSESSVTCSANTAVYSCTGDWSFSSNTLSVRGTLTPQMSRIRFYGSSSTSFNISKVTVPSSFSISNGTLSTTTTSQSVSISSSRYSNYVYADPTTLQNLVVTVSGTDYTKNALPSGDAVKSIVVDLPTSSSHAGWSVVGGADSEEPEYEPERGMPTDISLYSTSGIIKVSSDYYNIYIPVSYMAYKNGSCKSSSYIVAFLQSPSNEEYTLTGEGGNSVQYWMGNKTIYSVVKGDYTFVDLQKMEEGTWHLRLVQANAGDWRYYYKGSGNTDPYIPDYNGHEYVDLGLSVKWATCNVGASKPEDYGDYYAWGETETKAEYNWSTYKWCNGSGSKMTKYSKSTSYWDSSLGTSPDNKTVLDPDDDVAHVKWGGDWRMPTDAELTELRTKCSWKWTSQGGVNGYVVTGPNGNSIFLPAAGSRRGSSLYNVGPYGYYWSSSLNSGDSNYACDVYFHSDDVYRGYSSRYYGQSVRAVCP